MIAGKPPCGRCCDIFDPPSVSLVVVDDRVAADATLRLPT
jgi:hypothetical protein